MMAWVQPAGTWTDVMFRAVPLSAFDAPRGACPPSRPSRERQIVLANPGWREENRRLGLPL
jgi:hypothetical protein